MKKSAIILLVLLVLPLVSAAEIQLERETYQPGELLQAEIHGNFIDSLAIENVFLYRDRSIPIIYDILKSEGKYLIYMILPFEEGNYSIQVKNARYTSGQSTSTETIIKEFKIIDTNQSALSIKPGFISTTKDFSVTIKNLGTGTTINAELEATSENKEVTLSDNQEKTISFSIGTITEFTKTNLKIGDYNIPVFIYPKETDEHPITTRREFRFNPQRIKTSITRESDYLFEIYLENLGNKKITNITLSIEPEISDAEIEIESGSVFDLDKDEKKLITIRVNSEIDFETDIVATSDDGEILLPLELSISENASGIVPYISPVTELGTCEEIGGSECEINQECNESFIVRTGRLCCPGNCIAEGSNSQGGSKWIWGVIILLVVGGAIGFFFWRMKKKQKLLPDFLKKRTENAEKRMAPTPPPTETRNSLSKI